MKLFLCGDVMTGRGIDQILPEPCDPAIDEPWAKSALDYVALAEQASGPIPRPADPACTYTYIWGDALAELEQARPDARIVNLETAVTDCDDRAAKGINYRMSPGNAACLRAAAIDCCVLANNHVLDWGRKGLEETLDTLHGMGMRTAGAGRDADEASEPARLARNLLVFAFALESAGVPADWAAGERAPGVSWLPDLSSQTSDAVAERIIATKRPGDLAVVSIHWGANWGYHVSHRQRSFAHRLIDGGAADLVHGHSAHNPGRIEIYRERLILYACGDFLNDYEGIAGHESFRPELVLMYFAALDDASGRLRELVLSPMRIRRFRLQRANQDEAAWLAARIGGESGIPLEAAAGGRLRLR
jgi:poly-gamma-glutamate synthesis protein (capsule biosynthesis protein)